MNIRKIFTKWYVKQGYTFWSDLFGEHWVCPFWIKPFLVFFSPSVYMYKIYENYWRIK